MSKFTQIHLILYVTCLTFLNLPNSGEAENLLSRLFKRAQNSHRPLIVILDSSYLKEKSQRPAQKEINALLTSSEEGHHEPLFAPHLNHNVGLQPKKRPRPAPKSPVLKKPKYPKNKFYRAREAHDQRQLPRSPIVKSLLRISNDLRCDARNDCADICNEKFMGRKKKTCVIKCEVTYECKIEEKDDSCNGDECDIDSCDYGSCEEAEGSTKGYKMSGEQRCKKGRC